MLSSLLWPWLWLVCSTVPIPLGPTKIDLRSSFSPQRTQSVGRGGGWHKRVTSYTFLGSCRQLGPIPSRRYPGSQDDLSWATCFPKTTEIVVATATKLFLNSPFCDEKRTRLISSSLCACVFCRRCRPLFSSGGGGVSAVQRALSGRKRHLGGSLGLLHGHGDPQPPAQGPLCRSAGAVVQGVRQVAGNKNLQR